MRNLSPLVRFPVQVLAAIAALCSEASLGQSAGQGASNPHGETSQSTSAAKPQERAAAPVLYVCPPCGLDCHDLTWSEPGNCTVCGMALIRKAAADEAELADKAQQHFAAREWEQAAEAYRKLTLADPDNGRAWHHLGYSLHMLGRLDEALPAHQKAAESQEFRTLGHYNVACVHALQGRKDEAFAALDKALEAGFDAAGTLESDSDMDNLRSDPRFKGVQERVAANAGRASEGRRNVAIFVHDGVELLDFAGPGEVFAAARTPSNDRAFNVYLVASSTQPIVSQGFVTITPQYTFDNCPRPAIIVLPGGATNRALRDEATMAWVRRAVPESEITISVCTGALILAEADLLDGLTATTHWGSISGLRAAAPKATVVTDRRFVDNGRIVTSAGVSAGIDSSLHVVARLLGEEAARQTARYMEYNWRPEEFSASPHGERNGSSGANAGDQSNSGSAAPEASPEARLEALQATLAGGASAREVLTRDGTDALRRDPRHRAALRRILREHPAEGRIDLTADGEPGDRLVVRGTVADPGSGEPVPNAVVYAFQTDAAGLYAPEHPSSGAGNDNPRLFGFVRTDDNGRFELRTVLPGRYPGGNAPPRHIHYTLSAPGYPRTGGEFLFDQDPPLSDAERAWARNSGFPVVTAGMNEGVRTCEVTLKLRPRE